MTPNVITRSFTQELKKVPIIIRYCKNNKYNTINYLFKHEIKAVIYSYLVESSINQSLDDLISMSNVYVRLGYNCFASVWKDVVF